MSSTDPIKDSGDTPVISTSGDKKKSIEDMSKEELLQLFQKIRAQTLQIANEKKEATGSLEKCQIERDDLKSKALQVVKKCKELEEKLATSATNEKKYLDEITLLKDQLSASATSTPASAPPAAPVEDIQAQLTQASLEITKYKSTLEKVVPKLKEIKASLDAKTEEYEIMTKECDSLRGHMNQLQGTIETLTNENDDLKKKYNGLLNNNKTVSFLFVNTLRVSHFFALFYDLLTVD
jgi:chromosome segregation ATPase